MKPTSSDDLAREIENFESIARTLLPRSGEIPVVEGIDIAGVSLPLGGTVGGDHTIYVDFQARFDLERRLREARTDVIRENLERLKSRAGILLADVAGHRTTDATMHIGLHHAFLTGLLYELDMHGEVTTRLFENLNIRFYRTSSFNKYITVIYGEIAQTGEFNFLVAGHPPPVVFSREYNRIVDIGSERLRVFYPIGMFPSEDDVDREMESRVPVRKKRYTINRIRLLSPGDILLLYTDGLQDHGDGDAAYFPDRVQEVLRRTKDLSAREICAALTEDLESVGPQQDDISFVVVKKTWSPAG